jgi:hypothetical protein
MRSDIKRLASPKYKIDMIFKEYKKKYSKKRQGGSEDKLDTSQGMKMLQFAKVGDGFFFYKQLVKYIHLGAIFRIPETSKSYMHNLDSFWPTTIPKDLQ